MLAQASEWFSTAYLIHIYVDHTYLSLGSGFAGELSFEADLFGTLLLRFRENLEQKRNDFNVVFIISK